MAYYNKIEDALDSISERGNTILGIPIIEVIVWNLDLPIKKEKSRRML